MQTFINVPPHFQQGSFPVLDMGQLLAEPSLFSCSVSGMRLYAGPLARCALEQILEHYDHIIKLAENEGLSAVCDVRVHRLMPGQYPGIPGWHCDMVPRNAYHGQPNFQLVNPKAFHIMTLLSSEPKGVSNTEFVQSTIKPRMWDREHVYKDLHSEVEKMNPDTVFAKDGQFVWFNQRSIHRARPCIRRGVRLFLRFSMVEKPPIYNETVKQLQVYSLNEENGW